MDSDNSPPTTLNTKKRRKNTEESDIDNESRARYNQTRQEIQKGHILFPRFLMMMPDDEEKSLHKLSSFAIQKGIEGLAGEPKSIKRLRSGDLLIEVDRGSHSTNLQKATELAGKPIKVSPHRTLNTSKGVIRTPELRNTTNEEIIAQLGHAGAKEARILTKKVDGKIVKLNTAIITFRFPTPPETMKMGFERVKVQLYVPQPLRCFKCQRFGHHRENCKRDEVCGRCGQPDHNDSSCNNPVKCVNCSEKHTAFSKDCPVWQKEKEIQKVRTEQKISFPEARKIVEGKNNIPTRSFASVAARKVVSVGCQTDSIVIMSATGATVSAVTLANPQIQKKPGIQKTTNVATTTAEPIVKHANSSAANTKQSGSADKTKASRLSTQKSETVTNKSKDDSKSSEKQKPKIKHKPKPPDRLTKAMKNPVSTYNQFQAMEVVEPADDEDGSDDGVSLKLAPTAAAIHAQLNPGKKKQP